MTSRTRELLSVGIDVGTTTTQVVFSRLVVRDVARLDVVPRLEIDAKSLLYASEPYLTPLISPEEVDVESLVTILRKEYETAGIDPADVETGAVIITGETARAGNADAILTAISELAGDFVVTVAGPNLEAQIAGRGSGAAAYSAERYTQVTNVDIGGGSSNAAVFRLGRHVSSAAAEVGGRQLTLAPDGTVTGIAPCGRSIIDVLDLPLHVGLRTDVTELRRFCDAMADVILDLVEGVQESPLHPYVALTPPLREANGSTALFLSGGVGWSFFEQEPTDTIDQIARFGDVGPLLARVLREHPHMERWNLRQPTETMRATVLGAASQTVTLSGSTIWAQESLLPLRNLPVVEPQIDALTDAAGLASSIRYAVSRWDATSQTVAVALEFPQGLDYQTLTSVAGGVVSYADADLPAGRPVVLVTEHDVAQALGQTINGMRPDRPLVAIDQIGLGEGDYIDIGTPIFDGRVVPVSVKTLVFTS